MGYIGYVPPPSAGGGGASINDTTASGTTVYSSSKTETLVGTKAAINDSASSSSTAYSSSKADALLALKADKTARLTGWVGTGSDGAVVLDGTTAFAGFASLAGTTYTLTRDVHSTTFTVNSGVTFYTAGYKVYGQISGLNNGTMHCNGGSASGATAGAAAPQGSLYGGAAGTTGTTGAGANGVGPGGQAFGGNGGNAGAGSGNAAGSGGAVTGPAIATGGTRQMQMLPGAANAVFSTLGSTYSPRGGASGGAGGGDGTNAGGGGGGGGGVVLIVTPTFVNNGAVNAFGGDGGSPSAGNCGGGGPGGGGLVVITTTTPVTGTGTIAVTRGAVGTKTGTGSTPANSAQNGTVFQNVIA